MCVTEFVLRTLVRPVVTGLSQRYLQEALEVQACLINILF